MEVIRTTRRGHHYSRQEHAEDFALFSPGFPALP